MLFVLPVLFLVQKIDFADPDKVFYAQLGFGVVQGLVLLISGYLYLQINKRNDQTQITVTATPSPFGAAAEPQRQTIRDYDIAQLRKFVQQVVIGMGIAVFLFVKWAIVPPMAIQCVLNPVNLFGNSLFKLFVLGESADKHPRPFPEENPLAGLLPTPAAPAAATPAVTPAEEPTPAVEDKKPSKEAKKKN